MKTNAAVHLAVMGSWEENDTLQFGLVLEIIESSIYKGRAISNDQQGNNCNVMREASVWGKTLQTKNLNLTESVGLLMLFWYQGRLMPNSGWNNTVTAQGWEGLDLWSSFTNLWCLSD